MEGEVFRENRFSSGKIILTYKENFVLSSLYHRGKLISSKNVKSEVNFASIYPLYSEAKFVAEQSECVRFG